MTDLEKIKINELKNKGYGYKKIATELSLSQNTVKSYLKRTNVDDKREEENSSVCLFCGKAVIQNEHRKIKKFCSDKCRYNWHNSHKGDKNG